MELNVLNDEFRVQLSGIDHNGKPILSVLVKTTFVYDIHTGELTSDTQQSLINEPQLYDNNSSMLQYDTDLFPYKASSDVIIKGHAYSYDNKSCIEAVATINGYEKRIHVIGNRQCKLDHQSNIIFSTAKQITKIPLNYMSSYGGRDERLEKKYGSILQDIFDSEMLDDTEDISMSSPFLYPRNPCGKGYLIEKNKQSVESLQLPNLEDPKHLLNPENLIAGNRLNWHRMPLPQATDWINYSWFPRIAFLGLTPPLYKRENEVLIDIQRGDLPEDILDSKVLSPRYAIKVANGASPGLQIPHLKGGEIVKLKHFHPEIYEWFFNLPNSPKIWTDGRNGKLNETTPVIQTLSIDPDRSKITILWRGSAEALRLYHSDELKSMPFKVEI